MSRRRIERGTPEQGNAIDMNTGEPIRQPSLPLICERIRFYRKNQGMGQKVFAEKIGAQANTVNNWERGRSRPDVSLLPRICDVLGITLEQVFGQPAPGSSLSEREAALIGRYRQMNAGDRYIVDIMVKTMLTVEEARNRQKGRKKIFELPLIDRSLAAGIGDPTEYEGRFSSFYLYDVPGLERADCVFRVSGDSMEPDFHDGDYVLVERIPGAPELSEGEIGAFAIGNELYIKVYRADGLHSLNPRYPIIRSSEDNPVYMIGRVVGKVDEQAKATKEDIQLYDTLRE